MIAFKVLNTEGDRYCHPCFHQHRYSLTAAPPRPPETICYHANLDNDVTVLSFVILLSGTVSGVSRAWCLTRIK